MLTVHTIIRTCDGACPHWSIFVFRSSKILHPIKSRPAGLSSFAFVSLAYHFHLPTLHSLFPFKYRTYTQDHFLFVHEFYDIMIPSRCSYPLTLFLHSNSRLGRALLLGISHWFSANRLACFTLVGEVRKLSILFRFETIGLFVMLELAPGVRGWRLTLTLFASLPFSLYPTCLSYVASRWCFHLSSQFAVLYLISLLLNIPSTSYRRLRSILTPIIF